jgi:hypothetical protein
MALLGHGLLDGAARGNGQGGGQSGEGGLQAARGHHRLPRLARADIRTRSAGLARRARHVPYLGRAAERATPPADPADDGKGAGGDLDVGSDPARGRRFPDLPVRGCTARTTRARTAALSTVGARDRPAFGAADPRLGEIAHACHALLLDRWGVLHGGIAPLSGRARDPRGAARRGASRWRMLSNAPRR